MRAVLVTFEVEALLLEAADDLADLIKVETKTGARWCQHELAAEQTSRRGEKRRGGGAYEAPLDAVRLDHDEGLLGHCCCAELEISDSVLTAREDEGKP